MPARVEYRLGSIFDTGCDILVIPSSAGGTVSPSMADQLRKEGLPFPTAGSWGSVNLGESSSPRFGAVAYAASLRADATSAEIVRGIGQRLGSLARRQQATRISAPLLGSGSGDLAPAAAADALAGGFLETAPFTAVLTISIRDPWTFQAVTGKTGEKTGNESPKWVRMADGSATASPPPAPSTKSLSRPAAPVDLAPPAATPAAPTRPAQKRTRVFISYSHADAPWLERLQKHLRPLERDGALVWDDTRIKAGAQWRDEIREALAEAKVAILLISADFLASDFIARDELPPLLIAAEDDGATILPVIISASGFDRTPSLSRFQAVNDPRKPLVKLRRGNREEVLDAVARAVEDALKG